MHEGELSGQLGLAGWPAVAEEAIIARDVLLAEHVGSRLHICHVSTAGSVEILRWAKSRGITVTAEVTPHHLLLTHDLAATYDPIYKVNLPFAAKATCRRSGRPWPTGIIDIVATDHAPHAMEDKGVRVGRGRIRHARPADRTCGGQRDHGPARPAGLAAGRRPDVGGSGQHRPGVRPRPPDRCG